MPFCGDLCSREILCVCVAVASPVRPAGLVSYLILKSPRTQIFRPPGRCGALILDTNSTTLANSALLDARASLDE